MTKMIGSGSEGGNISSIKIAIPDSGPLITLASTRLLPLLSAFKDNVKIIITDIVLFEVTQNADYSRETKDILDFIQSDNVVIEKTSFGFMFNQAKENNPGIKIPRDMGEISIQSYVAQQNGGVLPGDPALVLFEDNWFIEHENGDFRNAHLITTSSFLKGLYLNNYISKKRYDAAIKVMALSKRSQLLYERPAGPLSGKAKTDWLSSLDEGRAPSIKKQIDKFRDSKQSQEGKAPAILFPKNT